MKTIMTVTVVSGKQTELDVTVTHRSVNEKRLVFQNGKTLSEYDIGRWICTQLYEQLKQVAS